MYFPVLPFNNPAIHFERNTFRLCNVDRLQVFSETAFFFYRCRVIIVRGRLVNWSSHRRYINVYDLLGVGIENGREI